MASAIPRLLRQTNNDYLEKVKLYQWLAFAAVLAVTTLLWSLKEILIQLFAGVVLAIALCALVEQLRLRRPMPRLLALFITITFLIITLGVVLAIVVPPFTEEFQELLLQLPNAGKALWELAIGSIDKLSDFVYGDNPQGIWDQRLTANQFKFAIPDTPTITTGLTDGISKLLGLAGDLGNSFIQLIFILAVTLMITLQPDSYKEVTIKLVPSFYRRRARVILKRCGDALCNWMIGLIISSTCVALLAGISLSLLGVKLVVANALLAGLLNIIPNLGPVISTIFPISVALLDAPWKALAVLGLYIIIQNIESYVITPSVMQHQTKLLPGLTLTAQFIFTVIFGPLGLLLALPLAVVIGVLIKEIIITDLLDNQKAEDIRS